MAPSLTIVLPIHNGEARLRGCVGEILELASELTPNFSVLIVDDGSTDDTFSAAEELSARYPQISVRRHRQRRGLGPTLEVVRRRVRSDVVIVHDGVSYIDPNQIRTLWRERVLRQDSPTAASGRRPVSAGFLAEVSANHQSLAAAHGRLLGFQLVTGRDDAANMATPAARDESLLSRSDSPQPGIGQIPPLPRPKFLTALAQFAFGE